MERTRIVLLRHRYLLGANLGFPEDIGHQGLLDTFVGQVSVSPDTSAIAVELGPIALRLSKHLLKDNQLGNVRPRPESRNNLLLHYVYLPHAAPRILCYCCFYIGRSASYHVQKLVLHISITVRFQMRDLSIKTLPLRLSVLWIELRICIVSSIG